MNNKLVWGLSAIILIVILAPAFAQDNNSKTNIAVIDLSSRGGLSQSEIGTLTDRLRSLLVRTNAFNVVDRGKMEEILAEQGFQMTGCTSAECVVEAGQILGVEQMISGSIGKIGRLYTVDIILIDVGTSQIIKSITRDYQGEIEGLVELMQSIANELGGMQKKQVVTAPETGGLYISSKPNAANIYLDDKQVGKTPLKLEKISPGQHNLKLELQGFVTFNETVAVEKNKIKTISADLKEIFTVSISSTPSEAEVIVNSKNVGKTPFKSSTAEDTKLEIELRKENYNVWKKSFVIKKDLTIDQKLEMTDAYKKYLSDRAKENKGQETVQKKSGGSKIWWWIGGGAAVVATTAYFLISGSSSDETNSFPAPPGRP
jgi:TolB-like protein